MSVFSERSGKILNAIVRYYILTAEPVSSKAIAAKYCLGLSPATIRNIMAELEDEGFLIQPHTSAGRVPTDKSFRFYIDSLSGLKEPPEGEKDILKRTCEEPVDNILMDTAKSLSMLTSCAGVMFIPGKDNFRIRHISFLPLDRTGIMMLLVSSPGHVTTRLIRTGFDCSGLDLERISNYLNSIAGGLTVRELRAKILMEMEKVKSLYDELLTDALKLGAMGLEQRPNEEDGLYVEGKVNIFERPEFRDDFERMKKLFSAFEEKSLLVKILDKSIDESGIHIYLGSESAIKEFEGLSFVTAPYGRDGEMLGTIGVIGPVRMDYSKIIPLVDYTAGLLSKFF